MDHDPKCEKAEKQEPVKDEPIAWFIDVLTNGTSTGRYEVAAREYWGEDFTIPIYTRPQPDLTAEVERIGKAFSKEVSEWRKLTMQQQRRVAAPNKRHGECSPSILTTGLSGRKEDK